VRRVRDSGRPHAAHIPNAIPSGNASEVPEVGRHELMPSARILMPLSDSRLPVCQNRLSHRYWKRRLRPSDGQREAFAWQSTVGACSERDARRRNARRGSEPLLGMHLRRLSEPPTGYVASATIESATSVPRPVDASSPCADAPRSCVAQCVRHHWPQCILSGRFRSRLASVRIADTSSSGSKDSAIEAGIPRR